MSRRQQKPKPAASKAFVQLSDLAGALFLLSRCFYFFNRMTSHEATDSSELIPQDPVQLQYFHLLSLFLFSLLGRLLKKRHATETPIPKPTSRSKAQRVEQPSSQAAVVPEESVATADSDKVREQENYSLFRPHAERHKHVSPKREINYPEEESQEFLRKIKGLNEEIDKIPKTSGYGYQHLYHFCRLAGISGSSNTDLYLVAQAVKETLKQIDFQEIATFLYDVHHSGGNRLGYIANFLFACVQLDINLPYSRILLNPLLFAIENNLEHVKNTNLTSIKAMSSIAWSLVVLFSNQRLFFYWYG